jgi:predicted PurR-regulated permease PerM
MFEGAVGVGLLLMNVLIVVVGTFFLVRSSGEIAASVLDLVPPRHRVVARRIGAAVDEALSGFIRGQLSVCVVMACVYALLLTLLGVPGGAVIGVLAGLLNFLPYVGISVGALLALMSVGLDYSGPVQVLGVVGVFTVMPVVDGTFITPSIVGNKVGLNPYVLILALLVGSELMGFLGLLLAVPTTAVLVALLRLGLEAYKASHFYLDGAPEAEGEAAETQPEQPSA